MSDRVAIISGSTVGRDHFPFPVPDLSGGTIYPISMPLDAMAAMFFRIRKWRVHGSMTSTSGSGSFDWIATIGDDVNNDIGLQASTITRESSLVLPPYLNSGDNLDSGDGSIYEVGMFVFDSSTAARYSPSSFYPAFFVHVSSGSPIATALDTRSPAIISPIASSVVAKITINSVDYTFTLYVSSLFVGGVSGSFIIEPYEYWPYATKAGLPVYDTSTGAQLRDPFS